MIVTYMEVRTALERDHSDKKKNERISRVSYHLVLCDWLNIHGYSCCILHWINSQQISFILSLFKKLSQIIL